MEDIRRQMVACIRCFPGNIAMTYLNGVMLQGKTNIILNSINIDNLMLVQLLISIHKVAC